MGNHRNLKSRQSSHEANINFYCPNSIPYLQGQASRYLLSRQILFLAFTLEDIWTAVWVANLSCATNIGHTASTG